jgi:hypothetical protein
VRAAREDPVLGVVEVAAAADFKAVDAEQEDAGVVALLFSAISSSSWRTPRAPPAALSPWRGESAEPAP